MRNLTMTLCLILLTGLMASSCARRSGPEAVAAKFLTHIEKGEFEKASVYATEQTQQMLSIMAAFAGDQFEKPPKHENLTCEVEGDNATCTYYVNGEPESIDMVFQDGKWLVNLQK
jgi:hypothetical protein